MERLLGAAAHVASVVASAEIADLPDADLLAGLRDASEVCSASDLLIATLSAEVARRSTRDQGHDGLAQRNGHRNVTSLVQNITGQSRADVSRALQTGEELVDAAAPGERESVADAPASPTARPVTQRWRSLLRTAALDGRLTSAQYGAIRTGLGEPPVERYPELEPDFLPAAWADAVELLLEEARELPLEELRAAARIARDRLDPVGVTLRFEERFAARSFRTWVDEHGQHHARIAFDDDAAAWVHSILEAALRPRRGPRFVGEGAAERTAAADADERSNEQLQYDTLMAVLRTGAAADPRQAFGDRQPGVRIIVDATAMEPDDDTGTRVTGVGHLEDGGHALPGGVVETYLCDAGTVPVIHDPHGRPLDLGREQRLFTQKQRIAIGVREGGCIGEHCVAPISRCEFHHLDHWWEHHGRTDVDDGVPLCRNHHLGLHNRRQRISRQRDPVTGDDSYWLHDPPDPVTGVIPEPRRLRSRSPRRFASL